MRARRAATLLVALLAPGIDGGGGQRGPALSMSRRWLRDAVRLAPLLVSLGTLGACGSAVYDKPALTYSEWRRDDAECRQSALGADEPHELDREAYARCMRGRGYRIRGD